MNQKEREELIRDFHEFCDESNKVEVPPHLFNKIKARLFPNPWKVFSKISVIHGVVGFLSLGICNQFGLNPFKTAYSLSDLFMKTAGHNFCMLACGILFISTTYLFSNIFLTLEELESIRKYEWLQLGVLSMASLASFYFFGAELVGTFVGLWLLGAVIGGILSIEISFKIRQQLAA